MALLVTRPLDKSILGQDGRLKMEWDAFFNLVQNQLNLLQRAGKFTMAAGASKTITDARITATSHVDLTATNASAAALTLYVANIVPGVSFDVVGAGAGTETYTYSIVG